MVKKFSVVTTMIAIGITSVGVVAPASAHQQYSDGYYQNSQRGYYDDRGYYHEADYNDRRGYDDRDYDNRRDDRSYRGRKCKSGTTGAILGGVLGGLLGREIGRGGYYNRPSTTGAIIGAGAGALAGRAVERSGNRC
jgi:hypothetical protein